MKWCHVVHHDGAIHVRIDEEGSAPLEVNSITDHGIVVQTLNRAYQERARRGTPVTGEVVSTQ